jgi:hypothetical protein
MSRDDLISRAMGRAEAPPTPEEWGQRITLNEGDAFVGRWRGEAIDEDNDDRRVYLLWDEDGQPCYHRSYAALDREIDRIQPQPGETVAIARSNDYRTQYDAEGETSGQSYGAEKEPNADPPPSGPASGSAQLAADDEFPY